MSGMSEVEAFQAATTAGADISLYQCSSSNAVCSRRLRPTARPPLSSPGDCERPSSCPLQSAIDRNGGHDDTVGASRMARRPDCAFQASESRTIIPTYMITGSSSLIRVFLHTCQW